MACYARMHMPTNVFYGWRIVGISTLVFAIVRGVNDAISVFFVAILEEFGWSRAAMAGVFSLAHLTEGTVSVGIGMLSDRFGLRRLVPLSACLVALGLVLASQAQTLWMFYVAYSVIFAIGSCGLGELSHVLLISRWFVRKRGPAIGIAMAGMGLGILLIVPLAQIFFGLLSDRLGYITTIILTYSLSIIGTFLLLSLHDPAYRWLLWCHLVVYGLGFGARGPVTSALVTQLFHGKHWGAILGFLEIGSGLGGTIGPSLSGLLFDWTGNYTLSFSLSMLMLALAVVCAWLAGGQWDDETS